MESSCRTMKIIFLDKYMLHVGVALGTWVGLACIQEFGEERLKARLLCCRWQGSSTNHEVHAARARGGSLCCSRRNRLGKAASYGVSK